MALDLLSLIPMLRKVVAVERLSQSNQCAYCHQLSAHVIIVCTACKKLQPFPATNPNFFEVFGLTPSLELDAEFLRRSFYDLCQLTHPDIQSQSDVLTQIQAAKWSTLINKAFQTLRTIPTRLEYLLESRADLKLQSSPPPTALAESYFELQEALLEGTGEATLGQFLSLLEEAEKQNQHEWKLLVSDWELSHSKETLLPRLKRYTDNQKYLDSLKSDLNKKRGLL